MADATDGRRIDRHHRQQIHGEECAGRYRKLARRKRKEPRIPARRPGQHSERGHNTGRAAPQRRSCRAFNAIKSVGHAHGLACERKTVIDTGFPMLIL